MKKGRNLKLGLKACWVAALITNSLGAEAIAGTVYTQSIRETAGLAERYELFGAESLRSLLAEPPQMSPQDSYHFKQLEMEKAWRLTRGNRRLKIAVISTGANFRLPGLIDSVAVNSGERGSGFESDKVDNDLNGYVDDVYGANTYLRTGDPLDGNDIGTFEASLLVSPAYGLAPAVEFIPIAVLDAFGAGTTESVIRGLDYAASRGADLVTLTVGGSSNEGLCQAIERVKVPVVTVAGNDSRNLDSEGDAGIYPALCGAANAIVVTATDETSGLSRFGNYGVRHVHLAAPGAKISGLNRFGRVVQYSGTSVAAAMTAAVAALVLSARPDYSAFELREALMRGSDPIEGLADKVMSGGRLNAYKALTVNVR
ncbi:MAG: S8 family serine peptidase [Oligoflexia bacterium]|nr:S8 family serine peptidase [Oligoflexia bacterium]